MKEKRPIKIVQTLQRLRLLRRLLHPWLQSICVSKKCEASVQFCRHLERLLQYTNKSYNSTGYGNELLWQLCRHRN
ncbi:unnamed protein product [Brassica oleracea]